MGGGKDERWREGCREGGGWEEGRMKDGGMGCRREEDGGGKDERWREGCRREEEGRMKDGGWDVGGREGRMVGGGRMMLWFVQFPSSRGHYILSVVAMWS